MSKQSRSGQLDVVQSLLIEVKDPLNTHSGAVVKISRTREKVASLLDLAIDDRLGPESVRLDQLIGVVVEQNLADREDRLLVVVEGVLAHLVEVVEGAGVVGDAVGACEVDAADERDFHPALEVLYKRVVYFGFVIVEDEGALALVGFWVYEFPLPLAAEEEVVDGQEGLSFVDMAPVAPVVHDLELNWLVMDQVAIFALKIFLEEKLDFWLILSGKP